MLFVAADLPWPPDGGGRIASLNVLESFARLFEVDLVALADPFRPVELDHLEALCRRVDIVSHPFTFGRHPLRQGLVAARSLLSREPYRLRKFRSRPFGRLLDERRAAEAYDLIHYEQFGVTTYRRDGEPSTAMVQNVESLIYRLARGGSSVIGRAWATVEAGKLTRREPAVLREFDTVFVISSSDRDALAELGVDRTIVVPMPAPPSRPARPFPPQPRILSLGSMSWFGVADGLQWFHDRVFPGIRARVPGVRWELVGPGASAAVRAFARNPAIELTGYVDDVRAHVEGARVAVVPLQIAGGIRMKILDLMAWGLPSVATEIGAQGLGFADGEGCYRRDDPRAFEDAVVTLLTDEARWLATADAGRRYVGIHHAPGNLDAAILGGVEAALRRARDRPS